MFVKSSWACELQSTGYADWAAVLSLLCSSLWAHIVGQVRQQVSSAHVEGHSGALERSEALKGCVDLLLHPGLQLPQLHARHTPLSGPRSQ